MARPRAKALNDAPGRTGTIYPDVYSSRIDGRVKHALGALFDLDQFGVNITVLEPGAFSALRHWHSAEDEFVYVLDGEVTLLSDDGEETIAPGGFVGFKAGAENGHCLVNRTDKPVRYLEVGTRNPEHDRVEYPDDDLRIAPGRVFTRKDGTPL